MMFITHTENYRNLLIEIVHDEDAVSPREDDNFGHMVCWHRRYRLGDGLPSRLSDRFRSLSSRYGLSEIAFFWRWRNLHKKHLLVLPLYLYDHSDLTISANPFSCPWDSGQIGWIFVTHQKIRQEYGEEDLTLEILERAKQALIGEVKIYDHYLRGDAWGYVLKNADGAELESCWGYLGDPKEDCLSEARRTADACLNHPPQQAATLPE